MSAATTLDRLARLAGIEDGWWDFFGEWRVVPADTKRVFLAAMGLPAGDEAQAQASLDALDARPWRRRLPPALVIEEGTRPATVALIAAEEEAEAAFDWRIDEELGISHAGTVRPADLACEATRLLDGRSVRRHTLPLPGLPPCGYHRLTLRDPAGTETVMALIVTPPTAFRPEILADPPGAWGIATQIYALRSDRDWGIGTYGDLAELAAGAARLGASCVGINPLHALFPAQPDRFSPYAPSSRTFLNTTYIDVEAIPEFAESREARRLFGAPGFQEMLARLRGPGLVDYPMHDRLTRPILEALYRQARAVHLVPGDESARGLAFRAFQAAGGRRARLFATFEALSETMEAEGRPYWREWPEEIRRPDAPGIEPFAARAAERIEFFQWLQFVADTQLGQAHGAGLAAGASIGLYRDLAVGIAGDGGEAWLEQDCLALGVSVGAPPDPLALKGQDWGLLPFCPLALEEHAFAPFIAVMRANMRHAGALRLDHAMAMQRLYWVPPGQPADQGAYVRYPADALFRLVALESRRNRCLVIGEDLGTVPEGFRERMERTGIFAYRVMVFEKDESGALRAPDRFEPQALAVFATHDLPSARAWWLERDITERTRLSLYPRPGQEAEERAGRARDRAALIAALVAHGGLPAGFPTDGALDEAQAEALTRAAHAYLIDSASRLMMVQIEDVLGLDLQMNLPGTTTEHPNWRQRYEAGLDALLADRRVLALAEAAAGRAARRAARPNGRPR